MPMRRLHVTVRGTHALMMDRMTEETLKGLITGVRPQLVKDIPFEDMAKPKVYRDPLTGKIGLPATMLYAALVEAGRAVKFSGKIMISTADSTKLFGLIEIQQEFLPFPIPETPPIDTRLGMTLQENLWYVDLRPGKLPKDGTAVGLVRPRFPVWGFELDVDYDDKVTNQGTIEALFYQAGKFQGLGSFRPNCRGPFGRFIAEKIVDVTPEAWKTSASHSGSGSPSQVEDEPIKGTTSEDGESHVNPPRRARRSEQAPEPAAAGSGNGDGR